MKQDDPRRPILGLNFDDDDRLLPATDYRYGANGRSGTSDKDSAGATEGLRGNSIVQSSIGIVEKIIGSCPDIKNNALISFVYNPLYNLTYASAAISNPATPTVVIVSPSFTLYNGTIIRVAQTGLNIFTGQVLSSLGNIYTLTLLSGTPNTNAITNIVIPNFHYIKRYFIDSQTTEFITNPALMGLVLNFQSSDRAINPRIIEAGFTQLLAWVTTPDGVPRLMDIDKMKSGGVYYGIAQDEQYIDIAKRPPNIQPTAVSNNDTTTKANFLANQFYQFAYRYIYDDFEISTQSPISDIYYTLVGDNSLIVSVNSGHHTVRKVQIIVRQNNGVSVIGTTNPDWYIFQTVDKTKNAWNDNTVYTVEFLGTEILTAVARIDSDINFQNVPDKADHIEVVSTNEFGEQIVLSAITTGKDNVQMDVAVAVTYQSTGIIYYSHVSLGIRFLVTRTVIPQAGDIMYVLWEHPGGTSHSYSYTLLSGDISSALNMANKFAAQATANGIPGISVASLGGSYLVQSSDPTYIIANAVSVPPAVQYNQYNPDYYFERGMKYGTNGKVGIVYYDANLKQCGIQVLGDYIIPLFTQRGLPLIGTVDGDADVGFLPQLQLTINNLPPSFATTYKVVIFEGTKYFWETSGAALISYAAATIQLVNTPLGYTFSEGDIFRFVTTTPTYFDYLIKSYDIGSKVLTLQTAANGLPTTISTFSYSEIYNINAVGDNSFYFEYPVTFNITGGYHQGNVQNQTISQPAIVTATNDFCYYRLDYSLLSQIFPAGYTESQSLSLTIYAPYNNKGRPQVETPNQHQLKYINFGKWSGALINNTQVNDLNVWDDGNYFEVDASKGAITGIRQIGFTLNILQWANINKTFLGRKQINNANGASQFVLTDQLISTINPSEEGFGTKHPGSVSVNGDSLYFLDTLRGKVIRSSTNGEVPISDYKAARYWRDKSSVINSSSNYEVISGVDQKYNDIYFSVINATDVTQETIYFNETQNRWKYFVDMQFGTGGAKKIIEWYGWVGQNFFTFIKGDTWLQNSLVDGDNNPVYLNLFGEDKELVVETIGMIEPDKVKIFTTHAIHSNVLPSMVEFFIPATTMYPNGMYSYLMPGNYSYKEGVLYAAIKNDWFTKGIPVNDLAGRMQIAGGRPMLGHVINVRLHYNTNAYTVLFSSTVGMIPSERS